MVGNDRYLEWMNYKTALRVFVAGAVTPKAIEIQREYSQLLANIEAPTLSLFDLAGAKMKPSLTEARKLMDRLGKSIWNADLFVLLNARKTPDPYALLQLGMAIGRTPVLLVGQPLDDMYMPHVGGVCYTQADFQRFLDVFTEKDIKPTEIRVKVSLLEVRYG